MSQLSGRGVAGAVVAGLMTALCTVGVASASPARVNLPVAECGTVVGLPASSASNDLEVTNQLGAVVHWTTDQAIVNGGGSSVSDIQTGDVVDVEGVTVPDGGPNVADSITDPAPAPCSG